MQRKQLSVAASLLKALRLLRIYPLCMIGICGMGLLMPHQLAAQSLHAFAKTGNEQRVLSELESGASPNEYDTLGFTPLHISALNGHQAIVRILLDKNASINIKTRSDAADSPLHLAAFNGHAQIVQILLQNGAQVNIRNAFRNTPLHEAALLGDLESIEYLVAHGANTQLKNIDGETPLQLIDTSLRSQFLLLINESQPQSKLQSNARNERNITIRLPIGISLFVPIDTTLSNPEYTTFDVRLYGGVEFIYYPAMINNLKLFGIGIELSNSISLINVIAINAMSEGDPPIYGTTYSIEALIPIPFLIFDFGLMEVYPFARAGINFGIFESAAVLTYFDFGLRMAFPTKIGAILLQSSYHFDSTNINSGTLRIGSGISFSIL